MLMEWLRGKSEEVSAAPEKTVRRKLLDVDPETPLEPSPAEAASQREEKFRRKLAASAKEGPTSPAKLVSYESMFRGAQRLLMEGNFGEINEGLTLNVARNAQNVMISSKCVLLSPQMSHWEVSFQMNGFSDIVAASYNTLSRWSLMYQRVSSTGALLLAQCMAQRQQGMTQGTVVGMLQYPWVQGGCTAVQYVKNQSFTLSHAQRIIRGLHVGSSLSWDPMTKGTSLSHGFTAVNSLKKGSLSGDWTPSKGEWKLAITKKDWAHDAEFAMQLDHTQKDQDMTSQLSFGLKKQFIGGSSMSAVLNGFSVVKAAVGLPFGGERIGLNQMHCRYNVHYNIRSGALKHGLVFTA
ncbi:putative Mitochondrial import receptor subunit ATOM40 [Trypanosoma cruzi]|uniref:Uncharacterized protein n=2 Tax=Trypanosoma cruzi TaxID=5693 RepID=Q4DWX7_TRYCC|nr:hypothetical protein, conserved [Trypanosoma cruzi]EAN97019.1 hypothetical protein, conserved [Trypanosoma cruzi]PWV22157.1 putative Mitochondrial import receptor subunit ATOM40 [Trypanosoma cruzi]RNC49701.1 hypothetical protein TcCL_NonESM00019 [Trypanosoma cruzi]|eukprot:XP_818870.1 hypothetical protein [Trypanosoma cruzi strain CL Brener]